jgi:hypothetical protein
VIFQRFSQLVAVALLFLIASPVTAPFAAVDFRTDASAFEETFDQGDHTSVATLCEMSALATFVTITAEFPSDASVISPDARPSRTAVLRL